MKKKVLEKRWQKRKKKKKKKCKKMAKTFFFFKCLHTKQNKNCITKNMLFFVVFIMLYFKMKY